MSSTFLGDETRQGCSLCPPGISSSRTKTHRDWQREHCVKHTSVSGGGVVGELGEWEGPIVEEKVEGFLPH